MDAMDPRLAKLGRSESFRVGERWQQFVADRPDIESELTDLDLTPEQDAAWRAFSQELRDQLDADRAALVRPDQVRTDRTPWSSVMTSGWQQYPSKSAGFTSSAQWQRVRKRVLKRDEHQCQIRGPRCTVEATVVDKIVPAARGGDPFDESNLQSVCKPCHATKTAGEALAGRASSRRKRRPRAHPSDYLNGAT